MLKRLKLIKRCLQAMAISDQWASYREDDVGKVQKVKDMILRLCLVAVKYFPERKIFSSVWLHYENCCRKYFQVFGSILKMLFSYKFFTFSRLFSQHPNKFY